MFVFFELVLPEVWDHLLLSTVVILLNNEWKVNQQRLLCRYKITDKLLSYLFYTLIWEMKSFFKLNLVPKNLKSICYRKAWYRDLQEQKIAHIISRIYLCSRCSNDVLFMKQSIFWHVFIFASYIKILAYYCWNTLM